MIMRKKSLWGIVCLSCVSFAMSAQTLKVEGGIGFSSLRGWTIPIETMNAPDRFTEKIYPFQFSIGAEYLDKGWFHLSSNIGIQRKGGKDKFLDMDGNGAAINEDYLTFAGTFLSLNTLFDVKKTSHDGYTFYAGVGPELNISIGETAELGVPELDEQSSDLFCPVNLGLRCELGVKKQFQRTAIGLVAAYRPTLTHLIKNMDVRDRTFTLGITFDFNLSRGNSISTTTRAW